MNNEKQMNIYEKILAIQSEIEKVKKNLKVETGKDKAGNVRSYKAVGEVDILDAVKPLEEKYKVLSFPITRNIVDTNILTTIKEYGEQRTESKQLFMRIDTVYRFVNVENPTEYIDMITYGDGVDSQDKAPGKAMTYADKYALMKAYKIETGDDPDQQGSAELKNATPTEAKATQKQVDMLAKNYTGENLAKLLEANGIAKLEDMPMKKASELIGKIMAKKEGTK